MPSKPANKYHVLVRLKAGPFEINDSALSVIHVAQPAGRGKSRTTIEVENPDRRQTKTLFGASCRMTVCQALGITGLIMAPRAYSLRMLPVRPGTSKRLPLPLSVAGEETINLAGQDTTGGRKDIVDDWFIGLSLEMQDGERVRQLTRTDNQADYWSAIGSMPSSREIKPRETVTLGLRLDKLADERGRPLSSLHGAARATPPPMIFELSDPHLAAAIPLRSHFSDAD